MKEQKEKVAAEKEQARKRKIREMEQKETDKEVKQNAGTKFEKTAHMKSSTGCGKLKCDKCFVDPFVHQNIHFSIQTFIFFIQTFVSLYKDLFLQPSIYSKPSFRMLISTWPAWPFS